MAVRGAQSTAVGPLGGPQRAGQDPGPVPPARPDQALSHGAGGPHVAAILGKARLTSQSGWSLPLWSWRQPREGAQSRMWGSWERAGAGRTWGHLWEGACAPWHLLAPGPKAVVLWPGPRAPGAVGSRGPRGPVRPGVDSNLGPEKQPLQKGLPYSPRAGLGPPPRLLGSWRGCTRLSPPALGLFPPSVSLCAS